MIVRLLLCLVCLCGTPRAQEDPRDIARDILGEGRFQSELPNGEFADAFEDRTRDAAGRRRVSRRSESSPLFDGLGSSEACQWVAFAIGGVLVVMLIVSQMRQRGAVTTEVATRKSRPHTALEPAPPTLAVADGAGDPNALAAAGDHLGAIRALLGGAFARLRDRGALDAHDWMTGREIVASAQLDQSRRAALAELVRLVERSLFGGVPATSEDFEHGRRAYSELIEEAAA